MAHGYPDYTFFSAPVNVAGGGTGLGTVPVGALLIGNGTFTMNTTSVGSADQVLRISHGGGNPDFGAIALDQAAATSGVLPVASGGSGTNTPSLVSGTGITISGSWPNQTVTNTATAPPLGDPVTVAHGGWGTNTGDFTSPGHIVLTAGGSNQNVTLTPSGSGFTLLNGNVGIGTSNPFYSLHIYRNTGPTVLRVEADTSSSALIVSLVRPDTTVPAGFLFQTPLINYWEIKQTAGNNDLHIVDDVQGGDAVTIYSNPGSGACIALRNPLALTSGGTGTTTPALVQGTGITITGTWPAQTITNSSPASGLGDPVTVDHGGTGQSSCSAGQLLIGSGANTAAWATPDGCRVYNDANESISNGNYIALTFNQERYDNGGMHSTSSNTSRITAQKDGVYLITGHVTFATSGTNVREVYIRLDGSTNLAQQHATPAAASVCSLSVTTLFHLSATHYVELVVYQNTAGALDVTATPDQSPEFAAQWLGP